MGINDWKGIPVKINGIIGHVIYKLKKQKIGDLFNLRYHRNPNEFLKKVKLNLEER